MDGWESASIGDICDVVNGGTPKTGVSEYWGGPHRWITPAEMGKRATPYIDQTERTITDQGLQNSSARPLPPYSVILSSRAPIGHLVINTETMATNQGCKGLVPLSRIDHKFLYYYLGSIVDLLNELGTGTTFKELSGGKLKEVQAPVPPIAEQRRIVAILDEAFEGIAIAKANAEKNLLNAEDLFISKLRSLFDEGLQADWPRRTLRDIAVDFGRGKSKHRPRNDPALYGGPYPFIQTGDVRGAEHQITDYTQTYSEAGLAQSKLWPKGTLCITIAANIAETGVLDFDACFPDSVIGVVVDDTQTTSKYVEYMLHTVKAALKAKGKGSAQDNINLATFENERFPFPDLTVQRRFVNVLDELSAAVQRFEDLVASKLVALDELKRSLLHQAFSGAL
jgi:type I restriction enzyme S subunit